MSQHDLILENADGATFRADLNAALAAIGSTQKGPSAPPAPLPGMLWIDDNTPSATVWTLFQYDGTDWISLGTLDTTANRFYPTGVAPLPISSAGFGQWTLISAGTGAACTLPAGGSWAYFLLSVNSSNAGFGGFYGGNVAAGGTTVGAATAGLSWIGFAWRIA